MFIVGFKHVEVPDSLKDFALLAALPEGDEAIPVNTPKFKLNKERSTSVILLVNDKQNSTFPVKGFAVNASDSLFKVGKFMASNLTKSPIGGHFDEKK